MASPLLLFLSRVLFCSSSMKNRRKGETEKDRDKKDRRRQERRETVALDSWREMKKRKARMEELLQAQYIMHAFPSIPELLQLSETSSRQKRQKKTCIESDSTWMNRSSFSSLFPPCPRQTEERFERVDDLLHRLLLLLILSRQSSISTVAYTLLLQTDILHREM